MNLAMFELKPAAVNFALVVTIMNYYLIIN